MSTDIAPVLERYQQMVGRYRGEKQAHAELLKKQQQAQQDRVLLEEARTIIQTVAQATQKQLEFQVSDLATTAMRAVFPEPYEMVLRFEARRGRSEADLLFKRGEAEIDPVSSSGGGPVDVAAFALKVSLWSLVRMLTRPIMMMDESFRYVSSDLQSKAGEFLSAVSHRLGLQLIMVTHSFPIASWADRAWQVQCINKRSKVTALGDNPTAAKTAAGVGVIQASRRKK